MSTPLDRRRPSARRPRAALTAACVLVAVAALAACSGDGDGADDGVGGDPERWDAAATERIEALADDIAAAYPGHCTDFGAIDKAAYVESGEVIDRPTPAAVGECSALDESLELVAHADTDARREFVDAVTTSLCARAADAELNLPGLHFAVGDDWSIQPDSEGVARLVAEPLGGEYLPSSCPGDDSLAWDPDAVERAQAVGAQLREAGLGCPILLLLDRDLEKAEPQSVEVGLAGAQAECMLDGDKVAVVYVFGDGATTTPDKLMPRAETTVCFPAPGAVVEVDPETFVLVADPATGDAVAAALDGTARAPDCP